MKLFQCDHCGQLLFFENTFCGSCGHAQGYRWQENRLSVVVDHGDGSLEPVGGPQERYRWCANHRHQACNWLVPETSGSEFCRACELNRIIPDISDPGMLAAWQKLELAKHRLIYSLLRLRLPVRSKADAPETGLGFDFLASIPGEEPVMTGHDNGLITVNLAEADPVQRETMREHLREPYRTLIGHFRHEVGHYYWDQLVAPKPDVLEQFRALFGDETADYGQALSKHYECGPPGNWSDYCVSSYATMHPWEDWAETWAHYLHLVDAMETAYAFGMSLNADLKPPASVQMTADFDPYAQPDFEPILQATLPIFFAVNSLNRGMGQPDMYPFVLPPAVMGKLRFVHQLVKWE